MASAGCSAAPLQLVIEQRLPLRSGPIHDTMMMNARELSYCGVCRTYFVFIERCRDGGLRPEHGSEADLGFSSSKD